ncbi:MAG: outer membrane protein assembly factor BamD [Deltaproteobacteria bacterium]|nr:outer membrane protein assembly factor BamD [Deltaproteobacteria bacterium]
MKSEARSQKSGEVCSRQYAVGSKNVVCLLLLTAYCLLLTVFTGCASTKDELANGSDPAFLYSEGAALYRDGDYNEAIDRLKKVMEGYPLSPLAVDAELLLADAYYSSRILLCQFCQYAPRSSKGCLRPVPERYELFKRSIHHRQRPNQHAKGPFGVQRHNFNISGKHVCG